MTKRDDFDFEPIPGLPERPPAGEHILWQGRPDVWALTKSAMGFWWVMGYFAVLAVWRFVTLLDRLPLDQALSAMLPFMGLAAAVGFLLWGVARVQARATVYTVTNKRIAMRIGAALEVTFNLPYKQIAGAAMATQRGGTGTIVLELKGKNRVSYLVAWPHVRPWCLPAQPALRCIPQPQHVAALIAEHAQAYIEEPQISVGADAVAAE